MTGPELRPFQVLEGRNGDWYHAGEVLARDLSGAGESALLLRRWKGATWRWPRRGVLEGRSGRGAFRVVDPRASEQPSS